LTMITMATSLKPAGKEKMKTAEEAALFWFFAKCNDICVYIACILALL
jgi:hypothetical protein